MAVDLLLTKMLDALGMVFEEQRSLYEMAEEFLLQLSQPLNNPLLHMNLSKNHGNVMIRAYRLYME